MANKNQVGKLTAKIVPGKFAEGAFIESKLIPVEDFKTIGDYKDTTEYKLPNFENQIRAEEDKVVSTCSEVTHTTSNFEFVEGILSSGFFSRYYRFVQ